LLNVIKRCVVTHDLIQALNNVCQEINDRQLREFARMSWDISPLLTIFLVDRLRTSEALVREVTRLLRSSPEVQRISSSSHDLAVVWAVEALYP